MKRPPTSPHTTPLKHFLWVLAALLVLLAISAGTAELKLGTFNTAISLGVSVTKTLLVMLIFMHETEARALTRLVSALGFIWLSMLIGLALFEVLTRSNVPAPW